MSLTKLIHTYITSFLSYGKGGTREFILFTSRFRDIVNKILSKPISCDLSQTIRVLSGSLNVSPELQQMFARTSKLL